MSTGKFRHLVDFYKKEETITETGGREYELVLFKGDVWASANTRKLSENFSADSENVIADVVVIIRYDEALDINNMTIKFNNKYLRVVSVDNFNFRNKELIFRCQYAQR